MAGPIPFRSLFAAASLSRSRVCLRHAANRLYSSKRPTHTTYREPRESDPTDTEEVFPDEEFLQYSHEFEGRDIETMERASEEMAAEELEEEKEVLQKSASEALRSSSLDEVRYPNLLQYEPILDSRQVLDFPPNKNNPWGSRVTVRNDQDGDGYGSTMFEEDREQRGLFTGENYQPQKSDLHEEGLSTEFLPLSPNKLASLYKFPLVRRRVVQQTAKGRIVRKYCMMIVGDGNGLVGIGEAKAHEMGTCLERAFGLAVRNMDHVERFENRTVWTDMDTKLGSTRIILRPRPVGFGLRCNPNLHQVFQAAGIKDISAKVWGSRNPINVIKAAFRMLQAGNAPLGMGDGVGGKGRKLTKGWGARSASEIEMQRGRKLLSLRT